MKARVTEALRLQFRPEFLNRIDEVIVFHALGDTELAAIVDLLVAELAARLEEQDLILELTPAARRLVATEGHDPAFGARPLKRAVQRLVENPLARALLEGRFPPGSHIVGNADPASGTLLFTAGDEIVMADASERRDARSAARPEPRDPLAAAIEEATAPAGKKRDNDLLN
jgi:ATP-dependent Clp protease ATP-binding subunit ClpA